MRYYLTSAINIRYVILVKIITLAKKLSNIEGRIKSSNTEGDNK